MYVQVLLTFLEYRGRCELGRKEWQSVLDEQFEMQMPITPYRSFPPQQVRMECDYCVHSVKDSPVTVKVFWFVVLGVMQ